MWGSISISRWWPIWGFLFQRDSLVPRYAQLVYNGYWFAPEREMLQAAMDEAAKDVTGSARVKLYKGSVTVVGR